MKQSKKVETTSLSKLAKASSPTIKKSRPVPHTFADSLMYAIHTMTFLTERHLEKKLSKVSPLSFSQFVILMGVSCQKNVTAVTQSMLADFLHMTEATVSRHIKTLEKDGLVEKITDSENKKAKHLQLTGRGEDLQKKAETLVARELESVFSCLSEGDRHFIFTRFSKLNSHLLTKE